MNVLKIIARESFFILWVQLLVIGSFSPMAEASNIKNPSKKELLSKSQLSYRASGGFTEVNSFSVIISCVDGKISTYRSLRNNRHGALRRTGTMTKVEYLNLWDKMLRHRVMSMPNAPEPKHDILDEFTVEFEAKVGKTTHNFSARGCSRPEASRHFAIRNLLDQAADMKTVWDLHQKIVRK